MANDKTYAGAKTVALADYIPAELFRTVHRTEADLPGGITEIKVVIDIQKPLAQKLSFRTSSSGFVYGFVRKNKLLRSLDKRTGAADTIKEITLNDWGSKVLMVIAYQKQGVELPLFVSTQDLICLLEHCRRVPQQFAK